MTESEFTLEFGERWVAAHPGAFFHKIRDAPPVRGNTFAGGGKKPFDAFGWYTEGQVLRAFAWEMKMHKEHTAWPFSAVESHQIDGLRDAASGGARAVVLLAVRCMLDVDTRARLGLARRRISLEIEIPVHELEDRLARGEKSLPILPYLKEAPDGDD